MKRRCWASGAGLSCLNLGLGIARKDHACRMSNVECRMTHGEGKWRTELELELELELEMEMEMETKREVMQLAV